MENIKSISNTLQAAIKCQHLFIEDVSGCGCGQKVIVYAVSEAFSGVKILARHKMVMGILQEEVAKIHALTLKLMTPEEWEAKKADLINDAMGEDLVNPTTA